MVAVDHPAAWPKAAVKAPLGSEACLDRQAKDMLQTENLIKQRDLPTNTLQTLFAAVPVLLFVISVNVMVKYHGLKQSSTGEEQNRSGKNNDTTKHEHY